jgi:porphobilinogen deaminase
MRKLDAGSADMRAPRRGSPAGVLVLSANAPKAQIPFQTTVAASSVRADALIAGGTPALPVRSEL